MNRPARLKLPSAAASAAAGAICVPLAGIGSEYLTSAHASGLLLFVWLALVLFVPMVLATFDLGRWRADVRENGWMRGSLRLTEEDLREFYLPAWGRLLLFFSSGVASAVLATSFRR